MVSKLHKIYPKSVTIVDHPCGYGKTTKMIQSLNAEELFLVVVPLKSEVRRVLESVASLGFEEPLEVIDGLKATQYSPRRYRCMPANR